MTSNPYEFQRLTVTPGRKFGIVKRTFYSLLLPWLASVPGACVGYWLFLPPPPPPGEYMCGLAGLPAMFIGAPTGLVMAVMGMRIIGRLLDSER